MMAHALARRRAESSLSVERSGERASLWREQSIEFDEPDSSAGDGGWTVGYLDILLLMVTLLAALLGVIYLQLGESRPAPHDNSFRMETELPPAMEPALAAEPVFHPAVHEIAQIPEPAVTDTRGFPEPLVLVEPTENLVEPAITRVPVVEASASTTAAAGIGVVKAVAMKATETEKTDVSPAPGIPIELEQLASLLADYSQDLDLLVDRHQLRLEVGNDILFPSGSADLSPPGLVLLAELAELLLDDRLAISVEGHTDDVPINTARFPSNWELSSIRATTVARELMALGVSQRRLRVTGYADTRPRVPNDSGANRALNRRVSLVLEMDDTALYEAQEVR